MAEHATMSWVTLFALGAFHGVNPAMGWLFAVALGMQERRSNAVWRAMLPLGAGHGLAVAAAVLVAILAGAMLPMNLLRWSVAAILIVFGITHLVRHRHPTWARMRVGMGQLTLWSFLMASAHGAGLMVVPVFLGMTMAAHGSHAMSASAHTATALLATALHAAGYLLVTAFVAFLVFKKLGVAVLRKAWFNLDLLWGIALAGSGVATALL
ncbi:MAG TPA: hypothetical protein VKE93_18250 [Candidatus Angelobacter sp.]|nr:hypothetical protein [Candidatus Angelobacter sp.]